MLLNKLKQIVIILFYILTVTGCVSCGTGNGNENNNNNQTNSDAVKGRSASDAASNEEYLYVTDDFYDYISIYNLKEVLEGKQAKPKIHYTSMSPFGIVASNDGYLYVGMDNATDYDNEFIYVYKTKDDGKLLEINKTLKVEGAVDILRINGNYLYAWTNIYYSGQEHSYARGGNLYIIDISQREHPKIISEVHTGHGDYADAIQHLIHGMWFINDYILLTHHSRNLMYDISDPKNPVEVDLIPPNNMKDGTIRTLISKNDYIWAVWETNSKTRLYKMDKLSFPESEPEFVLSMPDGSDINNVESILQEDYIYYTWRYSYSKRPESEGEMHITVTNISDPENVEHIVSKLELNAKIDSVNQKVLHFADRIVYMLNKKIIVLDISNPENIKVLSEI